MDQKKRHHYIPKAYLNAFSDEKGRVRVYRKDEPLKSLHLSPDGTGHRRYYYSQPVPSGGTDNNTLEDAFSEMERLWPALVECMHRREDVNDSLEVLFQFMALQHVRVPASRDTSEAKLAAEVRATFLRLHAEGKLSPLPASLEGMLDHVAISIDPHKSLHAMVGVLNTVVSDVFGRVGLRAIHNATELPFLTSDNPVIWFDPSVDNDHHRPYALKKDGPVMLFFPVSPTMLILGHSEIKTDFSMRGLQYGEAPNADWVEMVNMQICRYGYEAVIARSKGQEDLILAFADESPVYSAAPLDGGLVFGPRVPKPKWESGTDTSG